MVQICAMMVMVARPIKQNRRICIMNANKTVLIILCSAVVLLIATLIFVFWKKCKMSALKKAIITAVCIIVLIAATLLVIDLSSPKREYYDDIFISAEEYGGEIVIKEWSYLLGSGAEVYFKKSGGKEVMLGKLSGGDNGYCPFKDGKYKAAIEDGTLTLEWSRYSSGGDKPWQTETFKLPEN